MTNIFLHGILAKEFGESFKMKIYKASNIIKAIDVNRKDFNKRICDLSREGFHYTMIVDGKKVTELEELNIQKEPQEIHLVPLIVGSGAVIGAAILTAASAGLAAIGIGTAVTFTSTMVASQIVGALVMTAVSMGLQMLLAPKPSALPQISATTKALQESFSFSNKTNMATQGSPVPVGYGRLKVGGQVIQVSIKSYPQTQQSNTAMQTNGLSTVSSSVVSITNRV